MPTMLNNLLETIRALGLNPAIHATTYPIRKAWAEAIWTDTGRRRTGPRWAAFIRSLQGRRSPWPTRWTVPGAVRFIHPTERGARLETGTGLIELAFVAPDLVRVRYIPHTSPPRELVPYAIAKPLDAWPVPDFVAVQADDAYMLQSTGLIAGVHLATGRLFFATPAGRLLRADLDAGWHAGGAVRHRVALGDGEQLFGLGERATAWDRRGQTHVLWNNDPAGYAVGDDPINLNIPVYTGVVPALNDKAGGATDAETYLTFYENPTYGEFDLGETTPNIADHRFEGGELRYYFAAGATPTLIERYTELTGRHPMQPLWMLGYQQSRWSYDSEARVRKLAQDFQDHQVPCDAIHIDIDYMDGYRCFTWDTKRFPNPAGMAEDLRAQGIKLITIIDPGIKRDPLYRVYRSAIKGGHVCTRPDGRPFHAPVWPSESVFPDFTDPEARTWWGRQYAPLLDDGIAGFWNDMNEPAAFAMMGDRTLPRTVRHTMEGTDTSSGNHLEAHNVYGMLMARATREGLAALRPERRPVVITRAGWAGVQRYATSWTADNASKWASLRLTVPMMLGLGLSGMGFSGPDVGGFAGEATGELFTRWIQMAAFMPFFRAHTAKGTPDQEPWRYGEPYLSINRRFIGLRYELLPYLYTAMWQMCERGWPMVRPLGWIDPTLWPVDDAFLCGDKLLVAPVMAEGATARSVALPESHWYDFWTNRVHTGRQTLSSYYAPIETTPVLIREGTVLTLGEIGASVEQRKDKFLRLSVYPLAEPGEAVTELYEDAGEGMAYQAGAWRQSRFTMEQDAATLTLRWQREGAYEPPYEHLELTLNGLKRAPRRVEADGGAYPVIHTDPVRRTALLGVPIFDVLRIEL